MNDKTEKGIQEVPRQIFNKFLSELDKAGVSTETVERLKKALANGTPLEGLITAAILPDNSDS